MNSACSLHFSVWFCCVWDILIGSRLSPLQSYLPFIIYFLCQQIALILVSMLTTLFPWRFIVISTTFALSVSSFIPILHPFSYLSFLSWSRTLSTCPLYPSLGIVHSCGLENRPLILVPQFPSVCLSFYPRLRNFQLSACTFKLVFANISLSACPIILVSWNFSFLLVHSSWSPQSPPVSAYSFILVSGTSSFLPVLSNWSLQTSLFLPVLSS